MQQQCEHLDLDKCIIVLCIFIFNVTTVCFHVIRCDCVLSMPLLIPAVCCVICQPLSPYPHVVINP